MIDRQLADLGRRLEYPEFTDLVPKVERAIRERPGRSSLTWRVAAAAAAAVVVVAVLVPGVRQQVASWLGIEGVSVERIDPAESFSEELGDLGALSTIEGAADALGFPPSITEPLGPPDAVFVDAAGRAWLVYAPASDRREVGATGIGTLVTVFDATITPGFIKGVEVPAAQVRLVDVLGRDAMWIEGSPHVVSLVDESGEPTSEQSRLAANALFWQAGDFTFRLEADIGLEEAISIAESMSEQFDD